MTKPSIKAVVVTLLIALSLLINGVLIQYTWWREDVNVMLNETAEVIQTSKGKMEYISLGNTATDKNHLLILHGTPGGHDSGRVLADWLALGEETHVIIPSRPGYLRTPIATGQTPAQAADAMVALLDELKIDNVTVLGWGGGGPTAIELAKRYPQRTNGLVLLSAIVKYDEKYRFAQGAAGEPFEPQKVYVDYSFWGKDLKTYLNHWLYGITPDFIYSAFLPEQLANVEFTIERVEQMAPTLMPPSRREMGKRSDFYNFAQLPQEPPLAISVPTLVIHSVDDEHIAFAHGAYAASAIPGADLYKVEKESHFSTMNALGVGKFHAFLERLRK